MTIKLENEFCISHLRGYGHGDLVVRIVVEVPARLTAKQRELLKEFSRLGDGDGTPLTQGFFEKVKGLFG